MKVSQLMNRDLITIAPDDSVEQAVKLLRRNGVRHLLVMKKNALVGIISDRDVKRALDPQKTKKKVMNLGGLYFLLEPILVEEIMTPDPITIGPDAEVHHAAWIMVERRFGALPVVENNKTIGIITESDLLRYFAESAGEAPQKKVAKKKAAKGRKKTARRKKTT